jgi:hypothetical protein
MVLHVVAVPRRSTKNVSWPLPPTMKFEPGPPSTTFLPDAKVIPSFPADVWMKTFGLLDRTARQLRGPTDNSLGGTSLHWRIAPLGRTAKDGLKPPKSG